MAEPAPAKAADQSGEAPDTFPTISLSKGLPDKKAPAKGGVAFAHSAGGIGAVCTDEPVPARKPVPGRALVGGASKLFYGRQPGAGSSDAAQPTPARQASKADLDSRPSAVVWQQWSTVD